MIDGTGALVFNDSGRRRCCIFLAITEFGLCFGGQAILGAFVAWAEVDRQYAYRRS
jgi:hypothetical protein